MTLSVKALKTLRDDGLPALLRKATFYLSRNVERRIEPWNRQLEYTVHGQPIYREHQSLLARNEIFRARHSGRRCFVVGNGPSINEQDLPALASELTFVTNAFYKHPIVDQWQPSYYFLSDPHYYNGVEDTRKDFHEMTSRASSSTYFVPLKAREAIEGGELLPPEQTYYVALVGNLAHDPSWQPDFTLVQPDVLTVAQLAIMGAMFMNCSPIYLLGMDHDWLAHAGAHYTFYAGDGTEKHARNYGDLMKEVLTMWRGYESIRRVAESRGIRIVNATRGGFLDVFERADYESVIGDSTRL